MATSIKQLQAYLEAKGGYTYTSTSFQNLKYLMNQLGTVRTTTIPADIGQNITGVQCVGHAYTAYNSALSYSDLEDHSVNLKQLTCSALLVTLAYCLSRTTTNLTCDCVSRTARAGDLSLNGWACSCNTRTACLCNGRCLCNTQVTCECNTRCACNTVTKYE